MVFIGEYTFEIDMMETSSDNNETEVFANVFEELTMGGDTQKLRFREALLNNDFVECLKK